MARKTTKPPSRAARQGSGSESHTPAAFGSELNTPSNKLQATLDVVTILAARSRVAPWVVRAHIEAFGFGGAS